MPKKTPNTQEYYGYMRAKSEGRFMELKRRGCEDEVKSIVGPRAVASLGRKLNLAMAIEVRTTLLTLDCIIASVSARQ